MKTASIELLETRIAPASVFTYTDVDGDIVKVTSTLGDLNAAGVAITSDAGSVGGKVLVLLDLRDASFQGTSISTTVTKAPGGDGLLTIGRIDATGRDIGTVTIKGDLGVLDAGDPASPGSACKGLSVNSLGHFGLASGALDLVSNFNGRLDKLTVKFDVKNAVINVTDSAATNGTIGPVRIGGSLIGGLDDGSGQIFAEDGIGLVSIKGDVLGGVGGGSGRIESLKDIAGVTIGGSLVGGVGVFSGGIRSGEDMGPVKIGRNVRGGDGDNAGKIDSQGMLTSVTVGGSVVGGLGNQDVDFGRAGQIHADGNLGSVTIRGSLAGANDPDPSDIVRFATASGSIYAFDDLGTVRIGGSVVGSSGMNSGVIAATTELGPVKIGGDVIGGSATDTGVIAIVGGDGKLVRVTLGGSLFGGSGDRSGMIRAGVPGDLSGVGDLGNVTVGGSVLGGSGDYSGLIYSDDTLGAVKIRHSLIGGAGDFSSGGILGKDTVSISIDAHLIGGSTSGKDVFSTGVISVRNVGSITIGGSIITGTRQGSDLLSGSGDIFASGSIGALTVKGSLVGNERNPVNITANGKALADPGFAIGSITIGGEVERAIILTGNFAPANVQIGTVKIAGDFIASSIVAELNFPNTLSRIASITIGGAIIGSAGGGDSFEFSAHEIGAFKALGKTFPLTPDTVDPVVAFSPETGGDVKLREI